MYNSLAHHANETIIIIIIIIIIINIRLIM